MKTRRKSHKSLLSPQAKEIASTLPEEIIKHVMMHLDKKSFLNMRLVNEKFAQAATMLWQPLYFNCYQVAHCPSVPSNVLQTGKKKPEPIWKILFLERNKILNFGGKKEVPEKKSFIFNTSKKDMEHYTDKGYAHIYRNELDHAARCFEKAVRIKKFSRAYEGLARVYQQKEMYSHVIIFVEAALQQNPVNLAELLFLRGRALSHFNRFAEALNDYNSAVEYLSVSHVNYHLFLKPSELFMDRAIAHLELGNFALAFQDCDKVTQTERYMEMDCWLRCGKMLYDKKQYEESEKFLKKVKNKTKEYYLLIMQVQCAIGKYDQALVQYRSYEQTAENKSIAQPNHEAFLNIGITLFMNNLIKEAIEFFAKAIKSQAASSLPQAVHLQSVRDEDYEVAKKTVYNAAKRQSSEYGDDIFMATCFDIQIAWSYYYFLLGCIYMIKNTAGWCSFKPFIIDNEELKASLMNYTRCITLNPTLSEPFYYRALLQCYMLVDQDIAQESEIAQRKKNPPSSPTISHTQMAKRIMATNYIREALNDVNNALTLMNFQTDESKQRVTYMINLHLLKAYALHNLGRTKDALEEMEKAMTMNQEHDIAASKCYALKAVITKEKADVDNAYEMDKTHNKLISCPSGEDLLFVIIYLQLSKWSQ